MGFRLKNPFRKAKVQPRSWSETAGQGWGAPLQILYKRRALPPVDTALTAAYQTYLSPRYTAIGGGIPNKRDFVDPSTPLVAVQGVLAAEVGAPGILAGQFVSGPLTNVSTSDSSMPIPAFTSASYEIPNS